MAEIKHFLRFPTFFRHLGVFHACTKPQKGNESRAHEPLYLRARFLRLFHFGSEFFVRRGRAENEKEGRACEKCSAEKDYPSSIFLCVIIVRSNVSITVLLSRFHFPSPFCNFKPWLKHTKGIPTSRNWHFTDRARTILSATLIFNPFSAVFGNCSLKIDSNLLHNDVCNIIAIFSLILTEALLFCGSRKTIFC